MAEWTSRLRSPGMHSAEKQKVWTPYQLSSPTGFIRASLCGLLQILSDCWAVLPTSGWPQYKYDPFKQGIPIRASDRFRVVQICLHFVLLVIYYLSHLVGILGVLLILVIFGPVVVWMRIKRLLFWYRGMRLRLHEFFWIERRGPLQVPSVEDPSATDELWRYSSPIIDKIFSIFIVLQYYVEFNSWLSCTLVWDFATPGELVRKFRKFLFAYPPPFPIESYDLPYLQDSTTSPCQIVLMAVTERLTLEEMQHLALSRWVKTHRKLRSPIGHLFGLPCWSPLRLLHNEPRYVTQPCEVDPFARPEKSVFRIQDHVTEVDIDLKDTSVYEALSDFGTYCLPRNRPLWRIVMFQPSNADVAVRVRQPAGTDATTSPSSETTASEKDSGVIVPARSLSFIACQIHHSLGDGVAVSSSLVNSLFDPQPHALLARRLGSLASTGDTATFTAEHKPLSRSLAVMYYSVHFFRCLWYVGSQLVYSQLWCPEPPALFQPPRTNQRDKDAGPPGHLLLSRPPPSGRKYYAPPMVFEANEVRQLCKDIGQLLGVRPTVNDLFSHCLAVATGRLRSGSVIAELQHPLVLRQLNDREVSVQDIPAPPSEESMSTIRRYSLSINTCSSRIHSTSEDMSPMTIRGYTGELSADLKVLKASTRVSESMATRNAYFHRYATNFEDYVSVMIPMTCRLSPPEEMNNFTSFVPTRFPTFTATEARLKQEGCNVRSRESAAVRLNLSLRNLLATKGELDWLKSHNYRPMIFVAICFVMESFPAWLSHWMISKANTGLQVYFTNVPGPSTLLTLGGHPVWSLQSWPPSNRTVSTAVKLLTYGGDIQFLVSVDENELLGAFTSRELALLSRRDLLTITSVIGELVWDEFQTLKELVEAALRAPC